MSTWTESFVDCNLNKFVEFLSSVLLVGSAQVSSLTAVFINSRSTDFFSFSLDKSWIEFSTLD